MANKPIIYQQNQNSSLTHLGSLSQEDNMIKWCKILLFLMLIGFLASCTQLSETPGQTEDTRAWFTDQDIDNPVLSTFSTPLALKGSYDETSKTSDSPDVSSPIQNSGGLETQAVISNAKGFIYYIDVDFIRI